MDQQPKRAKKECGTILRVFLCNHRIKTSQNLKRLMILLNACESRNSNFLCVPNFLCARNLLLLSNVWKKNALDVWWKCISSTIVVHPAKPFVHTCECWTPKYQLEWKQIFYVLFCMAHICKWNTHTHTHRKSNEWLNLYDIVSYAVMEMLSHK